jgi:4-diphosphocytidyl-2-C-methyl-D-erythritol kinase
VRPPRCGRLGGGVPVTLLREVASGIGADVAFFLAGGTALGLGRGEEIYPLVDLPPHWIVVVRPPFGVSTAEAYGWYDEDRAAGLKEDPRELQILPVPWPTRAAQMINDLEPPVVRRHPEIQAIKGALRDAGAVAAAMSGSGSAVFGLFRGRAVAEKVVRPLSRGGARAVLTRTLTRAEYERRARPVAKRP